MSTKIKQEILSLLPEGANENEALKLTEELLTEGAKVRGLAEQEKQKNQHVNQKRQELLLQRSEIYHQEPPNLSDLRRISRELGNNTEEQSVDQALLASIQVKLDKLQEIVGSEARLPWRLRYVTDVDPEEQDAVIELGGGVILDSRGRNAWADYCDICDLELIDKGPRWRCFSCGGVQCQECQQVWDTHSDCTSPGMILEYSHPVFMRLNASAQSLSSTIANIFQVWSDRPCFATGGDYGNWLTYEQVLHRIRKIATLLKESGATQIVLCFPAGSADFYLADLACALVGVTSIGLPVPPPQSFPPCDVVICEKQLRSEIDFPEMTRFINIDDDECSKDDGFQVPTNQRDSSDSLYTIFFTSGSTGMPKAIPVTRHAWMRDFMVSEDCMPGCWFSFLPPCWATDRLIVYQSLYNGYRVGFSRRQPSLEEIIEDIGQLELTTLVAPPAVLQFMSTLEPPWLGSRLRYVACGGASIGESIKNWITETYGVPCIEAYGTTECGGIASDGRVVPTAVDSLKIKDPTSGEWLDPQQEETVVGELWVNDFNTKDLVVLSEKGTKLRVLGRSDEAVSFKMENGKWCSLIDIEQEIMRTCSPDLVQQALVLRNSQNVLVLVAQASVDVEEQLLLREIRKRVTAPLANFPRAILVTKDSFPVTNTYKVKRSVVIEKFREALEQARPVEDPGANGRDVLAIASTILGHPVDPNRSFLENGGNSITAVRWLKEMKLYYNGNAPDWRCLLNDPLGGTNLQLPVEEGVIPTVEPVVVDPAARHILLTGATGFLGRHVLTELLRQHPDTVIVCLVRPQSRNKLDASERVKVATEVPMDLKYRQVVHLAAKVDHIQDYHSLKEANVTLTEQLLCLRLAPMLYCSTSSTLQGKPPFQDGYTQSKWVSEQMVLRSGGTCVWPPFLVWGNPNDWLTRLIKHCVTTHTFPVELGFLPCSPVEICAKELVTGGPCSAWDLDLSVLFLLIKMETPIRPVSFASFKACASRDRNCALYPVLPLLQGSQVGQPRSPQLDLLPFNANDIKDMLMTLLK